jgi:hypothetical protein
MSAGRERLEEALKTTDTREADRLALEAIALEPTLAQAYALRGLLAAHRGDAVLAAHYLRVAYARGERSAGARVGLALCLRSVGEAQLADRIQGGLPVPPDLAEFAELVEGQGATLRAVLAFPLPPKESPALAPGERLPDVARSAPPAPQPPSLPPPPPPPAPLSTPPPAPLSTPPFAAPASTTGGPAPSPHARIHKRVGASESAGWLESHRATAKVSAPANSADWVERYESVQEPELTGEQRIDHAVPVPLVVDPGLPSSVVRSPVTGKVVQAHELTQFAAGAQMPTLERADLLEALAAVRDDLPGDDLLAAVWLPGPVMTGPGMRPRKLCRKVAMGLGHQEMVLRDVEDPNAVPARIPLHSVSQVEFVGDAQQVSLSFSDGRQIHLDLRALRTRGLAVAAALVRNLEVALGG